MTFRLESKALNKLKTKAKEERVSLNTLVNQIITGYAEWDLTAISAGWMVVPRPVMKKVFGNLSEDQVRNIGKETFAEIKDIVLFMTNKNDLGGFFSVLRLRAKKSGFQIKELENDAETTFIIQHDLGMNWSVFSKTFYENWLHSIGKNVEFELTDNTLVINVKK